MPTDTREILQRVRSGTLSIEEAEIYFKKQPFEDLGFAKLDSHRKCRQGFAEVVFGENKAGDHLLAIVERIYKAEGEVLATRVSPEKAKAVQERFPAAFYHEQARILRIQEKAVPPVGNIVVCTAGTADIAVAEEAALTAEFFGGRVDRIYDVGVSGLHRLLGHLDRLHAANVLIAVAGMEGALPSVLGGLVDVPVLAVPSSVGYGANFGGLSALLTMINSCANGISVFNIDNGYGAAYMATQINRLCLRGGNTNG